MREMDRPNGFADEIGDVTLDEIAGHCFGCGPANPEGLHMKFEMSTDPATGLPVATAEIRLTRMHEGPPGYVHGGIIATMLDEAMSKLNRPLGELAMTRSMEIDYQRPAPLAETLTVVGMHRSRSVNIDGTPGRRLFHESELRLPNGAVLARGKATFVAIDKAILAAMEKRLG